MTRCWIGVASRAHVRAGVAGGFAQFCHGSRAALERLRPGDVIACYSPREGMNADAAVRAFTALGEVEAGEPLQADMGGGCRPHRRSVRFWPAREAPVGPLLPRLSFTPGRRAWGLAFRRGAVAISDDDFALIAEAMGLGRPFPKIRGRSAQGTAARRRAA